MAEYGEWNRKGATLSDVTAKAEYGVSREFVVKGIQTGKLEYREGAIIADDMGRHVYAILNRHLKVEQDYFLEVQRGE